MPFSPWANSFARRVKLPRSDALRFSVETNFAIAAASVSLMNLILSDAKAAVVCSHYDAELDAYLSTPALVGRDGAQAYPGFIESISKEEVDKLKDSAREIQEKIKKFS